MSERLDSSQHPRAADRFGWSLAALGCVGAVASALASSTHARAAAAQDWPPFVLVIGLLLVGLVADTDGLFSAAGQWLARQSPNGIVLYVGAVLLVLIVTTVLNLDTSVAFLTPILVYAARSRGGGEEPLLYGCLPLSNAGSLLLPVSNLTNLIVLGHLHLSGGAFLHGPGCSGGSICDIPGHWSKRASGAPHDRDAGFRDGTSGVGCRIGCRSGSDSCGRALERARQQPPGRIVVGRRSPPRPFALLVGLNIGPNLFVTRIPGLVLVASGGQVGRRPTLRSQGQSLWARDRAAFDGCRPGDARRDRFALKADPPQHTCVTWQQRQQNAGRPSLIGDP